MPKRKKYDDDIDLGDEDYGGAPRGKFSKKGFGFGSFSLSKLFLLFVFIVGLIAGFYLTHYFIEPRLDRGLRGELAECIIKEKLQGEQLDSYLECMQEKGVDPRECSV